jgi:hypothetical protein
MPTKPKTAPATVRKPAVPKLSKLPLEKQAILCAKACGTADFYAVVKGGLYYRPKSCGYTERMEEAGKYTKAEAKRELVRGEHMHIKLHPCPPYDRCLNAMAEAEATLTEDEAVEYWCKHLPSVVGANTEDWVHVYLPKIAGATASQRLGAFLVARGLARLG